MGGARRAGAGAPPGRRDRTPEPQNEEDRKLPDLGPLPSESPRSAPAPRPGPAPNVFRGRGRGGRTRGDAKGGAAAARCWLRRAGLDEGWTRIWPFKGRPRGGARPWWLPSLLPGPAGQGLSVGLWEGTGPDLPRCPRPGPMALVTVSRSPPASGHSTPVGPSVSLALPSSGPRSWLPAGPGGVRPAHCQPPLEAGGVGRGPKCLAGRDWEGVWRLPGT